MRAADSFLIDPPSDMVVPETMQTVMTIATGTAMVILVGLATLFCVRGRTPLYLLICLGGAICMFNESALDVLGHCYFPMQGDWAAYTTLGRAIPVWVSFAYVAYFGGLTMLTVFLLRRGASKKQIWIGLAGIESLNMLLELPPLSKDLYIYYGEQPFRIAGEFPAVWLVFNCLGSFLAATIIFRGLPYLQGRRMLLIPLIPPVCQAAAFWVGVPYVAAINSDVDHGVMMAAAVLTFAIGATAMHTLVDLVADRGESRPKDGSAETPVPADVASPATASAPQIPALRR